MNPPNDHSDFAAAAERLRLDGDARAAVKACEAGLADEATSERGRIALALALLDLGDLGRARAELAMALAMGAARQTTAPRTASKVLASEAPDDLAPDDLAMDDFESDGDDDADFADDALADDELETAFAQAETNPDEMMDANRVVEQTLRHVERDSSDADFDVAHHPAYATETMASLLDRQGRRTEADALRQSLARSRESAPAAAASPRAATSRAAAKTAIDAPQRARAEQTAAGVGPDHARQVRIVTTLESWLYNLKRDAERDARRRVGAGASAPAAGRAGIAAGTGRAV